MRFFFFFNKDTFPYNEISAFHLLCISWMFQIRANHILLNMQDLIFHCKCQ